jgi:hypothetical protein
MFMADEEQEDTQWVHEEGLHHTHVFPDGAMINQTPDDGEGEHSIVPEEPLPESATETEKEIVEEKE